MTLKMFVVLLCWGFLILVNPADSDAKTTDPLLEGQYEAARRYFGIPGPLKPKPTTPPEGTNAKVLDSAGLLASEGARMVAQGVTPEEIRKAANGTQEDLIPLTAATILGTAEDTASFWAEYRLYIFVGAIVFMELSAILFSCFCEHFAKQAILDLV